MDKQIRVDEKENNRDRLHGIRVKVELYISAHGTAGGKIVVVKLLLILIDRFHK